LGSVEKTYPSGHGGGAGGSGVAGGLGDEGELGVETADGVAGVAGRDGVGGLSGAGELSVVASGDKGDVIRVDGEGDAGGGGEQERGDSCKSPPFPPPQQFQLATSLQSLLRALSWRRQG
jgi:hypothetical protein